MAIGVPSAFVTDWFTLTSPALTYPIEIPDRRIISRIVAIAIAGTPTIDLYSRLLKGSAVNITRILNAGNGKTQIRFESAFPVRISDPVTVATNTVSGYNVNHRVTQIIDECNIITDQDYSADGTGGTGVFDVTAIHSVYEPELYRVAETLTIASNKIEAFPDRVFVNQDPKGLYPGKSNKKPIYAVFSGFGTYRIAITHSAPEMIG